MGLCISEDFYVHLKKQMTRIIPAWYYREMQLRK